MSERRLTEEEIDILNESELSALERSSGDDCDMAAVKCVVRELRQRRSEDLTAEEREALAFARYRLIEYPPESGSRVVRTTAALATLDHVLGRKAGGE